MSNPFVVLPLLIVWALYAAYLRLAARLARHAVIEWRHAFGFAAIVGVLSMVGRGVSLSLGALHSSWIALAIGGAIHISLGTWFFSGAGITADGQSLGWHRALAVVVLALGLLLATALAFGLAVQSAIENLHLN